MSKTTLFLVLLILLFTGCQTGEQPPERQGSAVGPEVILQNLNNDNRYISVDEVADKIINQDPSLLLVDVRPHAEYDVFSLEGAINIPLEGFLEDDNQAQLDCQRYSIVFFSNRSIVSEQAWMLSRRSGCQDIYILQGGLTDWAEKIISPTPPPATAANEELELYQFRKAANKYFVGSSRQLEPEAFVETKPSTPTKPVKKSINIAPKKPKMAVEEEEGC